MLALTGSVIILLLLFVFGLRILMGFSMLLDLIRPSAPNTDNQQTEVLAPVLNPYSEATNSSEITINGNGDKGNTVLIYINDGLGSEAKVADDGSFETKITLTNGENIVSAKQKNPKNVLSPLSNQIRIVYLHDKPALELTSPEDGHKYYGEEKQVTVSGKTDKENSVTVNGRIVVVSVDGSFSVIQNLSGGENKINVKSTDMAGNETTIDRVVYYEE